MTEPHDLVAPYALHALDPAEERAFDEHLERCADCRRDLNALREAAAALAYAPDAPAPPPALRARLLEQARAERPNVTPLRPRPSLRWAFPAVAAAAAAAAIALGIWSLSLSHRLDRERSAHSADAKALALLATSDARRISLAGADGALLVGRNGRGALVVSKLDRAPSSKTYEAWVIAAGQPQPAGTFRGGDPTVVILSRPVAAGATVAVTVERKGGVRQPTSKPIFRTAGSA